MNERTIVTRTGEVLLVRPMTSDDDDLVVSAFEHLSPATARRRFFNDTIIRLGHDRLVEVVGLRPGHHVLLAFDRRGGLVGGARWILDPERPGAAEVAVTVGDPWQGEGIGHRLLRLLVEDAVAAGITRLRGHVLVDNGPARGLVSRAGGDVWIDEPGVLGFEIPLRPDRQALDDAIARALRTAS